VYVGRLSQSHLRNTHPRYFQQLLLEGLLRLELDVQKEGGAGD